MASGFIRGFLGGMGDAVAQMGVIGMQKKADMEKAEAAAIVAHSMEVLRSQNDMERAGREHGWKMDEIGSAANRDDARSLADNTSREKIASEGNASAERVAGMRMSRSGSNKIVFIDDGEGNKIPARYDAETDELVPVSLRDGEGGASDSLVLKPEELDKARVDLNTEGGKDRANNWIPGDEPSDDQIKARAYENRKGGAPAPSAGKPDAKPGLINEKLQKGASKPAATRDQAFAELKKLNPGRSDEEVWDRINKMMPEEKPAAAAAPKPTPTPKASPADNKAMSQSNDVHAVEQAAKEVSGRIDPSLINFNLQSVPGLRNPSKNFNPLKEVSIETLKTSLRAGKNFLPDDVRAAVKAEIAARQAAR